MVNFGIGTVMIRFAFLPLVIRLYVLRKCHLLRPLLAAMLPGSLKFQIPRP